MGVRIFRIGPGRVMNAISRMSPPQFGHARGNSSPTRAISWPRPSVRSEAIRQAVEMRSMFQLFDLAEALKVDVYPREVIPGELDRSSQLEIFEGLSLPVVSRTDAAASKLVWAAKGSQKSRRDLRQIVRLMPVAERPELDRLAGLLELPHLLAEILAERDEISG